MELFASFHRSGRAPVVDESSFFPRLLRSTTYEAGLKLHHAGLSGVFAAYRSRVEDETRPRTGPRTRIFHQGLELLLHAHPTEWVVRAGYQLDATRSREKRRLGGLSVPGVSVRLVERELEQSPRHRGHLHVWLRPVPWLELGLLGEVAGRRKVLLETSSYARLDAELRTRPPMFDTLGLELFVRTLNVFDREYEYDAFADDTVLVRFPSVGALTAADRSFTAGLVLRF